MPGGKYCSVENCETGTVGTESEKHNLFKFTATNAQSWTKFVNHTRGCHLGSSWSPCNSSYICSKHFNKDQFENWGQYQCKSSKRLRLVKNASPTIYIGISEASSSERKREENKIIAGNTITSPINHNNEEMHFEAYVAPAVELEKDMPIDIKEDKRAFTCNAPACISVETQTDPFFLFDTGEVNPSLQRSFSTSKKRKFNESIDDSLSTATEAEENHSIYEPSVTSEETDTSSEDSLFIKERKYIVYESALYQLLRHCPNCGDKCIIENSFTKGSRLSVSLACSKCQDNVKWESQPLVKGTKIAEGDLTLSASIQFCGIGAKKVLRMLKTAGMATMSYKTYLDHQREYLQPAIWDCWREEQKQHIAYLKEKGDGLVLGGDGRCDSPGFSAKYGSYSTIDLSLNKVIDIQLVQKNEVTSSNAMELEGFKRSMTFLDKNDLLVDTLVTDMHLGINKYVREILNHKKNKRKVKHFYDAWHVAKNIKKKLEAASKKGCKDLSIWIRSIVNHLHWVACSSKDGPPELLEAKWLSILNHIKNKHTHDNPLYKECLHEKKKKGDRKKKWLKPASKSYDSLCELASEKITLNKVRKMSTGGQTSNVEAFHSIIIRFAPKSVVYRCEGMLTRICLAGLHYNNNSNLSQKTDKDGNPAIRVVYPKFLKDEFRIKKVMEKTKYDYVETLMDTLFTYINKERPAWDEWRTIKSKFPANLSSSKIHPTKEEARKKFQSRYGK